MWEIFNKSIYGFWIDPNGTIYTITDNFGHKKFIENIMNESFDSDEDATEATLNDGWIRIVNGKTSLMVDYKYLMCSAQLKALDSIDLALMKSGYNHTDYILSYGRDYIFFDSIKKLIKRIRERSCDGR